MEVVYFGRKILSKIRSNLIISKINSVEKFVEIISDKNFIGNKIIMSELRYFIVNKINDQQNKGREEFHAKKILVFIVIRT